MSIAVICSIVCLLVVVCLLASGPGGAVRENGRYRFSGMAEECDPSAGRSGSSAGHAGPGRAEADASMVPFSTGGSDSDQNQPPSSSMDSVANRDESAIIEDRKNAGKRNEVPAPNTPKRPGKAKRVLFPVFEQNLMRPISEEAGKDRAVLEVTAVNAQGKLLSGEAFRVSCGSQPEVQTDRNGLARFDCSPGEYEVAYCLPNLTIPKVFCHKVQLCDGFVTPVRATFFPGAELTVKLLQALRPESAVAASEIALISLTDLSDPGVVLTAPAGTLTIRNIPAGQYRLMVRAAGFAPAEDRTVSLNWAENRTEQAYLWKESILEVHPQKYPSGNPVCGGTYIVCDHVSNVRLEASEVDPETGVATYRIPRPGVYSVEVLEYPPKCSAKATTLPNPFSIMNEGTTKCIIWYGNMYDIQCKVICSIPVILARLLKLAIPEYRDTDLSVITEYLLEANGRVPVSGEEGTRLLHEIVSMEPLEQTGNISYVASYGFIPLQGLQTEDNLLAEGRIIYDTVYHSYITGWRNKPGKSKILTAVDFQADDSKLETVEFPRSIYYLSRNMSSEKGKIFFGQEYQDIVKVHETWVFLNPTKMRQNTIVRIPQEDINSILQGIVRAAIQKALGLEDNSIILKSIQKDIGDAASEAIQDKVEDFIRSIAEDVRAKLIQRKIRTNIKEISQEMVSEVLDELEVKGQMMHMRSYLQATFIFLGPPEEAPNELLKVFDVIFFDIGNKPSVEERLRMLEEELHVQLSPAEMKEVKTMWELADGLLRKNTIDVRNEDAQKVGQALQATLQGDTFPWEKFFEECEKVGLNADSIAGIKNSLQSA